jgi:hypothetical protein
MKAASPLERQSLSVTMLALLSTELVQLEPIESGMRE